MTTDNEIIKKELEAYYNNYYIKKQTDKIVSHYLTRMINYNIFQLIYAEILNPSLC